MLQKLCPVAALNLADRVASPNDAACDKKNDKCLTGEAYLANLCNVTLTQQEWSRATNAINRLIHCSIPNINN